MTKNIFRKLFTVFVSVGLAAVMVYLGIIGTRLVGGVTLAENPPAHVVRLQVLHAGGEEARTRALGERVCRVADEALDIHIVEVREFDLRTVTRTVVVSRIEDKAAAEILAGQLGMDPDGVFFEPLEHNTRQVTATLIIGPDFDELLTTQESEKELQKES